MNTRFGLLSIGMLVLGGSAQAQQQNLCTPEDAFPEVQLVSWEGPSDDTSGVCAGGLGADAAIAVGNHWVVVAVNTAVFFYKKDGSAPTTGSKSLKDILVGEGSTGCTSCNCITVNSTDRSVYDPMVVFNPHTQQFALAISVSGGSGSGGRPQTWFLTWTEETPNFSDSSTFPFNAATKVQSINVRSNCCNLDTGTCDSVNQAHRSWIGFDASNFYMSHRGGSFQRWFLYKINPGSTSVAPTIATCDSIEAAPNSQTVGNIVAIQSFDASSTLSYQFVSMEPDVDNLPQGRERKKLRLWALGTQGVTSTIVSNTPTWTNMVTNTGASSQSPFCSFVTEPSYFLGGGVARSAELYTSHVVAENSVNTVRWYRVNLTSAAVSESGDLPTSTYSETSNPTTHAVCPWLSVNEYGEIGVGFVSGGRIGTNSYNNPTASIAHFKANNCSFSGYNGISLETVDRTLNSALTPKYDFMTTCSDGPRIWFIGIYTSTSNSKQNPACTGAGQWNTRIGYINSVCTRIDFNNNGIFDQDDIDDLLVAIENTECTSVAGCTRFDANYDCVCDQSDVDHLIAILASGDCSI